MLSSNTMSFNHIWLKTRDQVKIAIIAKTSTWFCWDFCPNSQRQTELICWEFFCCFSSCIIPLFFLQPLTINTIIVTFFLSQYFLTRPSVFFVHPQYFSMHCLHCGVDCVRVFCICSRICFKKLVIIQIADVSSGQWQSILYFVFWFWFKPKYFWSSSQ